MKFFINNNTTYNYSHYATRPKWLIQAFFSNKVKTFSFQKRNHFKTNSLYLKKTIPIHKVVFAPWSFLLSRKVIKKTCQKLNQSITEENFTPFKIKDYCATVSNKPQTKNFINTLDSKSVLEDSKVIQIDHKQSNLRLFQTKELLCWTSDLCFFNLRGYFSNLLKVLQVCRFAVRNNKKILFIKGSSVAYGQGKLLNPWLIQHERVMIPQLLNNLFNQSYLNRNQRLLFPQVFYFKNTVNNNKKNYFLSKIKKPSIVEKSLSQQNVLKKSLNNCKSQFLIKNNNFKIDQLNNYLNVSKKKRKYRKTLESESIKTNNIIKLWIKEGKTIAQQTAAGLTIPLTGFLTNSKTTFNTIYNLLNDDFYGALNPNIKSTNLLNKSVYKVKTNRLEKINFQKSSDSSLFQRSPTENTKIFKISKYKHFINKEISSIKKFKYSINENKLLDNKKALINNLFYNFPRVFNNFKLPLGNQFEKNDNKLFTQCKYLNSNNYGRKGWWIDYSSNDNYLPLSSNTQKNFFLNLNNRLVTYNEKVKKSRPLEYSFFGDLFTWQLKSQKGSSMFSSNSSFNKNKENILVYLKKQIALEKRGKFILKKKKPFFTYYKKQLQIFQSLKLGLKQRFQHLTLNILGQKKGSFLRKKQCLSTLATFIIFHLNNHNKLIKNKTKQSKKNLTNIRLPLLPAIKTKVKIILKSKNKNNYHFVSTYGNISLRTYQPAQQNKIENPQKITKKMPFILKTLNNVFTQAQKNQKFKKLPQKTFRFRTFLFYKYYKTIVGLNQLNQYKMFAKTPFVNNQLADLIFFVNPEKNQNLVNQANSLKIPTVGIVSGNFSVTSQNCQGYSNCQLKESVYYPILGNPASSFFTRTIINLIIKCLRIEKSKNKLKK